MRNAVLLGFIFNKNLTNPSLENWLEYDVVSLFGLTEHEITAFYKLADWVVNPAINLNQLYRLLRTYIRNTPSTYLGHCG